MTHSQLVTFFYYSLFLGAAVHIVLLFAEARAYRLTRITSLVPMIVGNVIGLLYIGAAFIRQYATGANYFHLAIIGASLYTAEVIVGVWGTVNFLRTVQRLAAAKTARK